MLQVFLGIAVFLSGVWIARRASKRLEGLKRYEFEHRSSGGVVGFESYDAAERHRQQEARNGCLGQLGVLMAIGGFVFTIAWINISCRFFPLRCDF